jgi:hypothetical protein
MHCGYRETGDGGRGFPKVRNNGDVRQYVAGHYSFRRHDVWPACTVDIERLETGDVRFPEVCNIGDVRQYVAGHYSFRRHDVRPAWDECVIDVDSAGGTYLPYMVFCGEVHTYSSTT